jgi:uncharacterized protein (TIGR03492 family)
MSKKILFVSNGYGEDTIAVAIIKALLDKARDCEIACEVAAFPLVGMGMPYQRAGIAVEAPLMLMPSEGLLAEDWGKLVQDLKKGLLGLIFKQIRSLKRLKPDLVVAVGDLFPVVMGSFVRRPMVFIGTAKSNYFVPYGYFERLLLKRYVSVSLVRDEATAAALRTQGLKAQWVGNAMLDALEARGADFALPEKQLALALFPGSHDNAYENFPVLLKALKAFEALWQNKFYVLLGFPLSLQLARFEARALAEGWGTGSLGSREVEKGDASILARWVREKSEILVISGQLGDILSRAQIVLGQAGTANEQAAAFGKPIVAFEPQPEKLRWYRKRQKGLLGEALEVVEDKPELIAQKLAEILNNPAKYNFMAQTGRERMGPPGGAAKMAEVILKTIP